jgi:hypothetical protein
MNDLEWGADGSALDEKRETTPVWVRVGYSLFHQTQRPRAMSETAGGSWSSAPAIDRARDGHGGRAPNANGIHARARGGIFRHVLVPVARDSLRVGQEELSMATKKRAAKKSSKSAGATPIADAALALSVALPKTITAVKKLAAQGKHLIEQMSPKKTRKGAKKSASGSTKKTVKKAAKKSAKKVAARVKKMASSVTKSVTKGAKKSAKKK